MTDESRLTVGIDASRALKPRRTGTERYALEIIRHLLTTPAAASIDWRLYLPELPAIRALFQSDTTPTPGPDLRVLPQTRLWTHRRLAAEVTAHPPDVLFVPAHVLPFQRPGVRLPPTVVTVHDLGYHFFPQTHTRAQRGYLAWSTAYAVQQATRLIAVSAATADDLQSVYGARPEKIVVVHEAAAPMPAVDADTVGEVLRHFAIAPPYALFVGTLQPRKNLVRLLEAYALLRQRDQANFRLVLAGADGWLSSEIHAAIERLQLSALVTLTGSVTETEHAALFSAAQFFVFPSLFEGFGLPVLEAQQAGVPVMTANNSSLPEIAGDAAILVDPLDVEAIAQAMLDLSQDEALRQRLIAAGHENVKRFSWSKAAAETLDVLREAAKSKA
jgi:glycosyltransferase involved in cell wall biosynthesis